MTTEIKKIETSDLDEVIVSSGLAIQEGEAAKQSYLPFLIQLSEVQEQSKKINYDAPTSIDEKIARELRLQTVKIRTAAGNLKDERKKIHLLKGNLEQASYNLIAASCKVAEETFVVVEKATEMAEKKRIEDLAIDRTNEMSEYTEIIPAGIGAMNQEVYDYYLNAAKLSYEAKIQAEKKAEEDRIAKEKSDMEAKRVADELAAKEKAEQAAKQAELEAQLVIERELAAAKEKELEIERQKAAEELKKQQEIADAKIEAELARVAELARIENEKANALLMEEQAKQIAYEQQVARDAKIMNDAIAAEKAKSAKLEADAKAARDAEFAKIEAERIAKENAAKAPRKEKLTVWVDSFKITTPTGAENDAVALDIVSKFEGFKKWAKNEINKL
mgnify:CR=1 FL=1